MKFFSLFMLLSAAPVLASLSSLPVQEELYQEEGSSSNPATRNLFSSELSDPDRFTKIKLNLPAALEEVTFWAHQLSEHALFLHLGIEDAPLKKRGLELHKKFENFRKTLTNPDISNEDLSKILPLAQQLRVYKIDILSPLDAGKWIGWIFPSFAAHVIRELDYFVDKLNKVSFSNEEELAFWNLINADHAGFSSHLVDPNYEQAVSRKAALLSKRIRSLPRVVSRRAALLAQRNRSLPRSEEEMFAILSLRSAKALDALHKKGKDLSQKNELSSVIHPALLDHVIREGERSIQNIERVKRLMETESAAGAGEEAAFDEENE